jgi:hypothetical protein
VPTVDREGRSETASAAAGAAGRKSENISHKGNRVRFLKGKNGEILKPKPKKKKEN